MNTADPELKKYMKMIAKANRWDQVILRGAITGMFAVFGTIIALVVLVLVSSLLIGGLKDLPIIDAILEQTKLDIIIENQLKNINKQPEPGGNDDDDNSGEDPVTLRFENAAWGITFSYPGYLSEIRTGSQGDSDYVSFNSATGALHNLDVFMNSSIDVTGSSEQRIVPHEKLDRIVMNIYENGAQIDGNLIKNAVYTASIDQGEKKFSFIGIANPASPKLAREVFISILESISIDASD